MKYQVFVIFCLILRIFQNSPKELHINPGSEKTTPPRFHAVCFPCKYLLKQAKSTNVPNLTFTFNVLLKHFNILV